MVALRGGAIHYECSSETCSLEVIQNSSFSSCLALEKGGAINYEMF